MSANTQTNKEQPDWYKDAIIYELHIKAFCDSNGDGIGDFNGLISKLDYLQSLGVTAIWVLPFYPSPLRDDGYDIADYYNVNPAYGDIKQFKTFLSEAHKRGLKVITELVINHTSDQHPWFQRARRAPKGSPERDFYVWTDNPHQYREVRIIFQDFEASNWTWDSVAQQYYWHRFFHHQPDLNYDNPLVVEEIYKVLDYWCQMGVDGFRLDAVPYLFEREGTNGENLPETHVFLKKLRKHVDAHYPGTLLLAEANMWPEDSASYFGNGDECQMNYHFPAMPRMFMALQMEDKHPITDIFEQTPKIPENCQWAMFLRNHDELTLEMVTDEERDYMYKAYTKDPRGRINLGIRHRLAPLLDNNRKKTELLNYLLFSLKGTPVIYYGDEIGMGDNFYLGDRDGVRTPMQWNADRNAGFSTADAFKLYLPVILDPAYHYESVNVESQHKNPSSLLWWMRRIINLRKKHKAFGRGTMTFLESANSKILAFTRSFEEETILVLVNLSRFVQPVEIDLSAYAGYRPVELLSKNKFPAIKENDPYFFSPGPYDCQWFLLENVKAETEKKINGTEILQIDAWDDLLERRSLETLETTILPNYLLNMRWFGGKGRSIQSVKIIEKVQVPLNTESASLLLLEVSYQSGLPDLYQLSLTFAKGEEAKKLQEQYPKSILSTLKTGKEEGVLYDAMYGEEFQKEIIRLMSANETLVAGRSELKFSGNTLLEKYTTGNKKIKSGILSAEQSNTSVTYDNNFFLKIYRKVDHVINPDLEITHFLTETAGFKNIPAFTGAIQWKTGKETMVLGMMQELVKNNGDAWTFVLDKLDGFYESALAKNIVAPVLNKTDLAEPLNADEIPASMRELLDPLLTEQIKLLGKRTAEMHLALASNAELADFKPEEFSLHYQRSLFSGFQALVRETFQNQAKNLDQLPEHIKKEAEAVLKLKPEILSVLKRIYSKKLDAFKTRIHGDYHLGQVLFTGKDFIILDFEGEPARSYSERRLKRSPLRDVACMIRSLHYAAYGSLILNDKFTEEEKNKLFLFADTWYTFMSNQFMQGYLETVKGSTVIPGNKEDLSILLETYILEKAIYELNYELNNRPDWTLIPLRGISAVMDLHSGSLKKE